MNEPIVLAGWVLLMVAWFAWWYPLIFRAPHNQKRPSVTRTGPTAIGLALECAGIFLAFVCRTSSAIAWWRLVGTAAFGAVGAALSWGAVQHLGRQFRINAGLYEDHVLVTTGPYAIVRHPIYASLLALLLSTLFLLTPLVCALISLALFVVGTEIRVAAEDELLASRFGDAFTEYKRRVKAYVPYVR
jgi:protein-S-isoprenylcysteine O-methyltransferase Ste14